MSKNILGKSCLLAFVLFNLMASVVSADIAPDPITKKPSVLVIVLIALVIVAAVVLLLKFFKKD